MEEVILEGQGKDHATSAQAEETTEPQLNPDQPQEFLPTSLQTQAALAPLCGPLHTHTHTFTSSPPVLGCSICLWLP